MVTISGAPRSGSLRVSQRRSQGPLSSSLEKGGKNKDPRIEVKNNREAAAQ